MNLNIFGITIVLVAVFGIVYSNPIKPEENSKDIEAGILENLEGMYKNYDDIDDNDEYDFELDLDGANSHGLGYYKLESEPIYLPNKKAGLFDKFDKFPKIDLFDKFHKFDKFNNQPQIQPIYDYGQYQQQYDVVAVPVKLKKCGLFGCKFNKKF